MAILIDWSTKVITVEQNTPGVVSFIGGSVYELDTFAFRLALKDLEDSEVGMSMPDTHRHNTQVLLGGIYYARTIEIINGYTITFEETGSPYVVNLVGSNNNILDVTNLGTVQIRSNNSAGLINVKELQHGIFGEEVHLDQNGGTPGTVYPAGTPLQPVNNVPDAMTIAAVRGFTRIHVIGNLTLDTGDNIEGMILMGENATNTQITVNSGADTQGCEIQEASVTGNLDGGTILRNCVIDNLNYINGFVYSCMINPGTIALGGSDTAHFLDCYSGVPGVGTPTIDCDGIGIQATPLAIRGYNGGIKLIDMTGGQATSIDLASGQVIIDSTCVSGTVVVRGDGKVIDENGTYLNSGVINGGLTLVNETTSGDVVTTAVAKAVWDTNPASHIAEGTMGHLLNYLDYMEKVVYCDPEALVNGEGSQEKPFNNITDAIDFAEAHNVTTLIVTSDIAIDRNVKNLKVVGVGVPEVDTVGYDLKNSEFHRVQFKGLYSESVIVQESVLTNGAYLNGFFENCAVAGNVATVASSITYMKNCASSMPNGFTPAISIGADSVLNVAEWYGKLSIVGCSTANSSVIINLSSGSVNLDATCISGTILITGVGSVTDYSLGATVINNAVDPATTGATPSDIADAVWDEAIADHATPGSFGHYVGKKLLSVAKFIGLK